MSQTFSLLEYGNYHDPCANADAVFSKVNFKSISKKKSGSSHRKIYVSSTSKGYDNVTTPYYLFFAPLTIKWSLTGG